VSAALHVITWLAFAGGTLAVMVFLLGRAR